MTGTGSARLPARSTATSVSPSVGGVPGGCQLTCPLAPTGDLLPVEEQNRPRSLVRPVAHLHPANPGNRLQDPHLRRRRVDKDRLRDQDRAAVALEADLQPVEPIRDDLARVVSPVPLEPDPAGPLVLSLGERGHVPAVRVDHRDVEALGPSEQEGQGGCRVRAAARGRQVPLELRLRHRGLRELQALGSRERRSAAHEQRHGEHDQSRSSHAGTMLLANCCGRPR